MNALFLTIRMGKGYGVDLVVDQLCQGLLAKGHKVTVACLSQDGSYTSVPIHAITPDVEAVATLARHLKAEVLVIHSSPFFELIPSLSSEFPCVVWEHGDPTPELFPEADASARRRVIEHKKHCVYPAAAAIVAISEFIKFEIGQSQAVVVPNACTSPLAQLSSAPGAEAKLRIGTLLRFGGGERFYKGNSDFVWLAEELKKQGQTLLVAGRGDRRETEDLQSAGAEIHLNLSEQEKWEYLSSLDIFVSFSLWEGFNLPLIEAQRSGAVALALDTGAHPETTPFVFANKQLLLQQIMRFIEKRTLLRDARKVAKQFSTRFQWESAVTSCEQILQAVISQQPVVLKAQATRDWLWVWKCKNHFRRLKYAWRIYGPKLFFLKVLSKLRS